MREIGKSIHEVCGSWWYIEFILVCYIPYCKMGRPDSQHILSKQTCSKLHVSHLDCTCPALRLLLHTVLQFGRVLMVCKVLRVLFLKVIYAASRPCHPICKYCRHGGSDLPQDDSINSKISTFPVQFNKFHMVPQFARHSPNAVAPKSSTLIWWPFSSRRAAELLSRRAMSDFFVFVWGGRWLFSIGRCSTHISKRICRCGKHSKRVVETWEGFLNFAGPQFGPAKKAYLCVGPSGTYHCIELLRLPHCLKDALPNYSQL